MPSVEEKQLAQEIRGLARRYCDGEITKGEYRRQRRHLLESLGGAAEPTSELDSNDETTLQQFDSAGRLWPFSGWAVSIMAIASVVLLGVIVAMMVRNW